MTAQAAIDYRPFAGLTGSDDLDCAYAELEEEAAHYLDPADKARLLQAAVYGAQAHEGQMRKSGEPYFIHPIAVARILASQRFDLPVLQAALLHDVLEDTRITKTQMAQAFGDEVTVMVDGVSKLDRLRNQGPHQVQAESFRKMLVAVTEDSRVIIIKLADRLHNMQTLAALAPEKRISKAKETLDIYASIAGRLGLFYFRIQLEDLAFSHLYPWRSAVLKKHYTERVSRSHIVDRVRKELAPALKKMTINASLTIRQRHLWGIYQRMQRKQSFHEACRTVPIRIITETEDECYRILGVLHAIYRPISGKFEDYIAAPKSNGYRSLHTSVLMARRDVLNVQIRTRDMHALAETGIIAVWHQHIRNRSVCLEPHAIAAEKYMRDWLFRLKEVQNITYDPLEFYDAIKKELSPGALHVYTPRGEVIDLPMGATPVDFAYGIHSEIGDHCVAAKVNGQMYPIFRPLELAQTVEIITTPDAHPHIGWLQFVVTARARAGIKHHLRSLEKKQARQLGRNLLDQALKALGSGYKQERKRIEDYVKNHSLDLAELLDEIAKGKKQAGLVASAILDRDMSQAVAESEVLRVHGPMDSAIIIAECCRPLPNEPIIGHIEPGIGIRIHRRQCMITEVSDRQDWIHVDWADDVSGRFVTRLDMTVLDRPKMLSVIVGNISACGCNIEDLGIERSSLRENARLIKCWLCVEDRDQLAQVIRGLRTIDGMLRISRNQATKEDVHERKKDHPDQ